MSITDSSEQPQPNNLEEQGAEAKNQRLYTLSNEILQTLRERAYADDSRISDPKHHGYYGIEINHGANHGDLVEQLKKDQLTLDLHNNALEDPSLPKLVMEGQPVEMLTLSTEFLAEGFDPKTAFALSLVSVSPEEPINVDHTLILTYTYSNTGRLVKEREVDTGGKAPSQKDIQPTTNTDFTTAATALSVLNTYVQKVFPKKTS